VLTCWPPVNNSKFFPLTRHIEITVKELDTQKEGRGYCNTAVHRYRCFLSDLAGFAGPLAQAPAIL